MVSMPSPPNPRAVADAQGAANKEAAIASGVVNNPNQNTPFGTQTNDIVRYERTSGNFNAGLNTLYTDDRGNLYRAPPNKKGEFNPNFLVQNRKPNMENFAPRYETTVNLSPAEQAKLDSTNSLQQGLLDLGNTQMDRVSDALSQPLTTRGLPDRVDKVRAPNLRDDLRTDMADGRIDRSGPIQTDLRQTDLQSRIDDPRNRVQYDIAGAGRIQDSVDRTSLATQFDRGGTIQGSIADGFGLTNQIGDAGAIRTGYTPEGGFEADRRRVEEAIMSRAQPAMDRSRQALEDQLTNQGLVRGTAAFNEAMDEARRAETDARMQAILAGGQEQSRMTGLARDEALFGLQAQGQQFGQLFDRANFNNQAAMLGDQRALARAGLANDAQAQQFGQNASLAQFGNDAAMAQFGQNVTAGQFANAAQDQRFGQNAAQQAAFNQAQGQDFSQQATRQAAFNDAQMNRFAQRQASGEFQNAAQQQRFGQNALQTQLGMQATDQNNVARARDLEIENAARGQNFNNALTAADFQNMQRQAGLQERMAVRNQPINEIGAFLGGGQVNIPQFAQPFRQGIQPAPVADSIYRSYEAERANATAAMSGLFGLGSSLVGGLPMLMRSDRRSKTDIQKVGKTDGGNAIYKYRYKDDPKGLFQIGVMAQELKKKQPEAVGKMPGGMLGVDYRKVR